jgi:hypothetical protein
MPSSWTQQAFVNYMAALASDTLKIMLLRSTYTVNPDNKFVSDIVASECTATNYTGGFGGAGRKTLASKTITADDTNNRAVFDAADPAAWTALGGATNNTLRYCAIIKEVTNDAASQVIAILDFGADFNTNGGDFSVAFNALGIGYTQV